MKPLSSMLFSLALIALAAYSLVLISMCSALWLSNSLLKEYQQIFTMPVALSVTRGCADKPRSINQDFSRKLAWALAWQPSRQILEASQQAFNQTLKLFASQSDGCKTRKLILAQARLRGKLLVMQHELEDQALALMPFFRPFFQ